SFASLHTPSVKADAVKMSRSQGEFSSRTSGGLAAGCPPRCFSTAGRTHESVRPPEAMTRANVRFHTPEAVLICFRLQMQVGDVLQPVGARRACHVRRQDDIVVQA